MGPPSEFDSEYGVEHDAVVVAAETDAFPSHCVLVLLLPSLGDEAVDLGSACGAEPIRVSTWSLLELDGLVLLVFDSAALNERSGLVEELGEEHQSLGLLSSHTPLDTLDIVRQLLSVSDVLWRGPSLLGSTSAHVLL